MPTDVRLSGLDVVTDKGIGIDFPIFGSVGSQFAVTYTTIDQAAANAKNLLLTNHGERVMQPTFGCNLHKTMFENQTDQLVDLVITTITSQMEYWLPYIFINDLQVTHSPDYNTMNINIKISLKNNTFDTRSIDLQIEQTSA